MGLEGGGGGATNFITIDKGNNKVSSDFLRDTPPKDRLLETSILVRLAASSLHHPDIILATSSIRREGGLKIIILMRWGIQLLLSGRPPS